MYILTMRSTLRLVEKLEEIYYGWRSMKSGIVSDWSIRTLKVRLCIHGTKDQMEEIFHWLKMTSRVHNTFMVSIVSYILK